LLRRNKRSEEDTKSVKERQKDVRVKRQRKKREGGDKKETE